MSLCKSITKLETVNGIDIMEVVVDDVTAYWFYDYSKALEFVNKDVFVTYRDDFYKGAVVKAVNTLALPNVINVLSQHETLRLYSDAEDNQSNLAFSDIPKNGAMDGCTFYCCKQTHQISSKAEWLELVIRDKSFRTAVLRIFQPDDLKYEGSYCTASLRRTDYGLQSDLIVPMGIECPENPEITIAKDYVLKFFADDAEAMSFITSTNLMEAMANTFDFEQGYTVVRLAMELCLCEQFYNITRDINVQVLTHALLVSYGHCATPNLPLSAGTANVMLAVKSKWSKLGLMLSIIDPGKLEKEPMERGIYNRIKDLVAELITSRKTYRM